MLPTQRAPKSSAVRAGIIFRLALTPVLWLACRNIWLASALLLALDFVDCATTSLIAHGPVLVRNTCATNREYQLDDKIVDCAQYGAALLLLAWTGTLAPAHAGLLAALLAWRSIGVLRFRRDKDPRVLVTHFDGIKEVLVAIALAPRLGATGGLPFGALVAATCACKIAFERWKNGRRVDWAPPDHTKDREREGGF